MPEVLLRPTPAMGLAIEALDSSGAALGSDDLRALLERFAGASQVTLSDVRALAEQLRAHAPNAPVQWLHELTAGSALLSVPAGRVARERDPALVKRLERLEIARQNEDYARMVKDITNRDAAKEKQSTEIASFKASMGVGVNLLVSVATMFTAGWFVTKNATGAGPTDVVPIIGGLAGAAATLLLETWLFVIRTSRVDTHVSKRETVRQNALKRTDEQQQQYSDLARIHDHYD
jgi:rhodanese-related sulfurtransferase